ncbi:hypothetical protein HYH03_009355 [Edaphochlamys debaryana]|uniref:Uncharacterized protein n=1 Tax=Edaphochlamys debaryana TaxID=47281 RepID=A0A835XZD9_9CHLO|nr:hypothetical protein HYH03_009355 [Edaphochlamys debaryana]|eukprot:KAG2492412.1 hypothetical protein HYH03_009355 [Edaphochlamys debaryana]
MSHGRSISLLLLLLIGAVALSTQAEVEAPKLQAGLREASVKRGEHLARAPDGSGVTDQPLPSIRAHAGINSASGRVEPGPETDPSREPNLGSKGTGTATATATGAGTGASDEHAEHGVSLWLLLAMTMVMALLSGVGASPYLFTGKLDPYWSGIANAVGCGVMLAASFDLLEESKAYSATLVLGGIILGVLAMQYSQAWLEQFEDVSFSDLQGADARKAMLIVAVMAAHAFGEGSGVGVSFSGPRGWAQGLLVTIAIGLHNIPEGMAVATIMVARGTPPKTALFWTLLSALPQGIVAVPSYIFVETFTNVLPLALGFAAGCMIWIVFAELIPDALETAEHAHVATAATLSAAVLQCISMLIAKLERADGTVASPILADLTVLIPDLLILAPAFLAPFAAAAGAGMLLPALPLPMGLTAGVGAWVGAAGLIASVNHHTMHKHTAVGWAAAGAVACVVLWRWLNSFASSVAEGLGQRKDSGGDGELVEAEAGQHADPHLHHRGHGNGQEAGAVPQANGWGPPSGSKLNLSLDLADPHRNNPYNGGFAGGADGAVHATAVAGRPGGQLERRNGYGGSGAGTAVGSGAGSPGGSVTGHHHTCAKGSNLHGHGKCCKACDEEKLDMRHLGLDLLPPSERPREVVRAALLMGAMLLLYGLPSAYELAGALLRHLGDTSTLLPPLVLHGLTLGLACVGIARAVSGTPGWKLPAGVALLFACVSVTAVSVLLMPLPAGVVPSNQIAFDTPHMADRLRAFASAGLLLASVGYLWPAAAHIKPRKVQLGAMLGVGACAAVAVAVKGLCAGTPYCLEANPIAR